MFCDNDASAYGRKPRRAYERMLAAVESGSIDAIVTWHNDRLHRSPKELEAFIDLVERSRVHLAVVTGGDYDLTTPDGRLSARIVGAVARKESEDRSRRVRRKHLELAELGRPAGQLGWGVRSEDEPELVREAARRVLKGDGLITISRDWNTQGARGVRRTLDRAHTAQGAVVLADSRAARTRRRPQREDTRRPQSRRLAAALDRQVWDQVRAVLLNPDRNTNVRKATRYLLTGFIHCGGCGAALFSRPRNNRGATCALDGGPAISWGSSPIRSTSW